MCCSNPSGTEDLELGLGKAFGGYPEGIRNRLREARRSPERLERVGFMPWTSLFVGFAIIGGGCLAMSLPVVLGNW